MNLTPRMAALAAVFLSACLRFNLGGVPQPGASESVPPDVAAAPTVTPPPITGGFSGGDLTPSQTRPPSASPAAAPSATATQPVFGPRAVELTVAPRTATLNVFARLSASPLYPTTVQLAADVLLSSGEKDTRATWRSLRPETATVDENGLVTAGSATGDAIIVATSLDGEASGTARITLTAFDTGNATVSAAAVEWRITAMECEEADEPCLDVAVPGPDFGSFDASDDAVGEQIGTASIRIGSDLVNTAVKVVTHALAPADLPGGMGPLGAVPYPADNEPTQARSDLGKKLFFDPKLSRSGEMSCATCHKPELGFADGRTLGLGNDGKDLPRHTPTALNAAYSPIQFWDGRAATLEDQAMGVFQSAREFNSDLAALVDYVKGQYGTEFQAAYGTDPTPGLVTKAIASYERKVLVSGDAPFDKWARGDNTALTPEAKIGLGMFLGKSGCVACHSGPAFSDGKFHNIGIPGSGTMDLGRSGVTSQAADAGAFKTPTLRNVALTAPYFHNGSRATLADAIRFYENFDGTFPNLDKNMTRSNFSTEALEFLNALTSPVATP